MGVNMKKTVGIVMLICTPIGWMWGWWHEQAGDKSGWVFPPKSWFRIEFGGMVLEDWLFYPITGFFFIQAIIFDPIKKLWCLFFKPIVLSSKAACVNKWIMYGFLVQLIYFGYLIFGDSGTRTAVCFGVPSLLLFLYIWEDWNVWHFYRTGLIIVPTEFIWDHIAVGVFNQWVYQKDSGIWGGLWINGIPCEMSPALGFFSWFFIFGMVKTVEKITNK